MGRLNDLYDSVEGEVRQYAESNEMPSGKYAVRVNRVSLKQYEKSGEEYIEVIGEVVDDEQWNGAPIRATWNFPTDYPEIAKNNMDRFKAFNKICGCAYKAEMLELPQVQEWYAGIVIACGYTKKPGKTGRVNHYWYFNNIISAKPEVAEGDTVPDETVDREPPPAQPPAPSDADKKDLQRITDEINLDDEDPFSEDKF